MRCLNWLLYQVPGRSAPHLFYHRSAFVQVARMVGPTQQARLWGEVCCRHPRTRMPLSVVHSKRSWILRLDNVTARVNPWDIVRAWKSVVPWSSAPCQGISNTGLRTNRIALVIKSLGVPALAMQNDPIDGPSPGANKKDTTGDIGQSSSQCCNGAARDTGKLCCEHLRDRRRVDHSKQPGASVVPASSLASDPSPAGLDTRSQARTLVSLSDLFEKQNRERLLVTTLIHRFEKK
jgi:hypothetical protein